MLEETTHTGILALETDGVMYISDEGKAQALNDYYINNTSLDESNATLREPEVPKHDLLENIPLTEQEVNDNLSILDTSKAYGPDDKGSTPMYSPLTYKAL